MTWTRDRFGSLPDGEAVEIITLINAGGMRVSVLTWGAAIHSVWVPDRDGDLRDVVLGHATLEEYLERPQYFGATVGRFANRIAGANFRLDGEAFHVPANNGRNSLHGGERGFDKANWRVEGVADKPMPSVTLRLVSPHGDQGYPGELTATATYSLDDDGGLHLTYRATSDRPTIVGLSNHVYWNLAGEGSDDGAMDHLLTIHGEDFLPTDAGSIPTGEFRAVAGTPFDFRKPRRVGERVRDARDEQIRLGRGYDHNWVVSRIVADELKLLARLEHPRSGRAMELLSNQPGLQFYSGNFLDGTTVGKTGGFYRMGDGIALEPQLFPDTPNRPEFGSARLGPGETYANRILWRFSIMPLPRP